MDDLTVGARLRVSRASRVADFLNKPEEVHKARRVTRCEEQSSAVLEHVISRNVRAEGRESPSMAGFFLSPYPFRSAGDDEHQGMRVSQSPQKDIRTSSSHPDEGLQNTSRSS